MFVLLKSRASSFEQKSEESKNLNFRQERRLTENERQKEERQKNTFAKCAIYLHREYNNKSVIYLSSERERLKRKRERERKSRCCCCYCCCRCRKEAAGGFAK